MASLLNVGAALMGHVLSGQTMDSNTALRQDISRRMTAYEASYKKDHEPLVVHLYAHWFLSLLAYMECVARYLIHLVAILIVAVLYYLFLCLTCGKSKVAISTVLSTQHRLFGLYWGLSCGIFWNLLLPWNPPLYAFRTIHLTRPDATEVESLQRLMESAVSFDCCCQCAPDLQLPTYKVLQGFLLSYGGCRACGGCLDMDSYVGQLKEQVVQENAELTRNFYQQQYNVSSYQDLLRGQAPVPASYNAYSNQPPVVVAQAVPIHPGTAAQGPVVQAYR